jgi:hypothetical protein
MAFSVGNNVVITNDRVFQNFGAALSVPNGGTGQASLTANGVIIGNGTFAVQLVQPGTSGNVLISDGINWRSNTLSAAGVSVVSTTKSWYFYTSSSTFTVPQGVTSIRAYAFGKGGNGANGSGGGGGGCAYGDIAVTPGSLVTITISAGVATVIYGGTTRLTGNPGNNGYIDYSGENPEPRGGTGGTASKHASVTNGGAYSGGVGGTAVGNQIGSGASSGSPVGVGINGSLDSGGSGWVSAGNSLGGGSGGGSSGASALGIAGVGRSFAARFTEPLLAAMDLTGIGGNGNFFVLPPGGFVGLLPASPGSSGGGGGGAGNGSQLTSPMYAGAGGNGAGGGGASNSYTNYSYNPGDSIFNAYGGAGGFGGGGGVGYSFNGYGYGGVGGYGGGGGGSRSPQNLGGTHGANGGSAIVVIYA